MLVKTGMSLNITLHGFCVNCHVLEAAWKILCLKRYQRISRYAPPSWASLFHCLWLLSGKFGALPPHLLSSAASVACASVSNLPTVRQST